MNFSRLDPAARDRAMIALTHTAEKLAANCAMRDGTTAGNVRVQKVYQRFWWPHEYARPFLWRKLVVAYRYFHNGREVDIYGNPL